MTSTSALTGSHLRTYNAIFQHPAAHNLGWHDVHTLFRHLGEVEEQPNGNTKVSRNGESLVLQPPRTKDVADTDELMALRRFLERSEQVRAVPDAKEAHWLLVIDHHEARLFRSELVDAVPTQLMPHQPDRFFRHKHNSRDFTRGREKPEANSYFEPIAKLLVAGGHVLIFGCGTGTGSEMEQFVAWLGTHHPEVAGRIIGTLCVDESHTTVPQLLSQAREFYLHTLKKSP